MKQSGLRSVRRKGPSGALAALLIVSTFMTALVVASAPPAEATAICYGTYSHNLDQAKASFESRCDREWNPNSGSDVCDWNGQRGFLCSGSGSLFCYGFYDNDIDGAIASYENRCGQEWLSRSGYHFCNYVPNGNRWWCFNEAY